MIINTVDKYSVPAGGALAADRSKFSRSLTEVLSTHPLIEIKKNWTTRSSWQGNHSCASYRSINIRCIRFKNQNFTGIDSCHFYDAASPIIYGDTVDHEIVKASRYDKGDPAFLNCPMQKNDYISFRNELIQGEQAPLKDFERETANFLKLVSNWGACKTRYWNDEIRTIKAYWFVESKWGDLFDRENRLKKRPHAIVQLRKEDLKGKLLNMVGSKPTSNGQSKKNI